MSELDQGTNADAEPDQSPNSPREHGHGYADRDPAAWLPGAVLDAEIFIPAVLDHLQSKVDVGHPGRIVDIGCGPGAGTLELAKRFPNAELVGLDIGEAALEIAATRAAAEGVADRVRFIRADFDHDMTHFLEPVDLVFASMSLHHTEDPGAALGRACALATPGGRLVVAEFGRPLRAWPEDHQVTTTGLWRRWQAASDAARLDHLGEAALNVNWLELLRAERLDDVKQFECDVSFPAPVGRRERDWLVNGLNRGLQHHGDGLAAADRAALEALLNTDDAVGLPNSSEAMIDTSRMIYTGIRR